MNPTVRNIFFNQELQTLRAGWRIALLMAIFVGANAVITGPFMVMMKDIPGLPYNTIGTGLAYIMLTLSTWTVLRFVDKRPFHSVGLSFKANWGKELFQGLLFGSSMMSLIYLIEYSAGMVVIEFRDLTTEQSVMIFFSSLSLYIIVGYGEELMFRGYLFQTFAEGTNKLIATLTLSLLFAAAHVGNPNVSVFGIINVGLAGIWLSMAYFKTGALWLPIGMHISWNFFQGFVYSYPVSGTSSPNSQIGKAIVSGPEWITGGTFGPEGGILATVMLMLCSLMIYKWNWVNSSADLWSYAHWKEQRMQSLTPAPSEPEQPQVS
ncbi:MAG: CPBP family intramembrane metalloprotease [Bacteroidetes bacterium]|nr:CPBP family intramembrane metalloprotease [Bacteroidota bacterium]